MKGRSGSDIPAGKPPAGDRPENLPGPDPAGCRGPRPDTLTAEDDRLLGKIARVVHRKGAVVLGLESVRPLSFLGSQALQFLNPLVQMFISSREFERLAHILQERTHLDRLLDHLEDVCTDPPGNGTEVG